MNRSFFCIVVAAIAFAQQSPQPLKTFATPEAAADALLQAAKQDGDQALLDIFGPNAKDLFPTDEEAKKLRQAFVTDAAKKLTLDSDATNLGRVIIQVGEDEWPFPIPLVAKGDQWVFDTEEGREEIAARWLGSNELEAIRVCLGYVAAQMEYAAKDRNNDGMLEFAQRILSTAGQKDGLYWEGEDSPAYGDITKAFVDAYRTGKLQDFRGYHFKILKAQGPEAQGGALNYVVKNKWMMGGFALIAWPAQYGITGVRTFMVNHRGIVYEKDLGLTTATAAPAITKFNPDPTWLPVDVLDDSN